MTTDLDLLEQFEIGGTFFELIEFSLVRHLNDGSVITGIYGVNVAKVREVVHMPQVNRLGSGAPGVAGIFELRKVPIPAINLCRILGDRNAPLSENQQIIVTEFSDKRAGFIVSSTHRIRRIAWDRVLPPSSDSGSCMSGMILLEDGQFLFILDLEKILHDIEVSGGQKSDSPYSGSPGSNQSYGSNSMRPQISPNAMAPGILIVDDSRLVVSNLSKTLQDQGYRVAVATNGIEGYETAHAIAEGRHPEFGSLSCIVTDIEMPLMDGLTMVKKLREDLRFSDLPILLHTSLSGEVTQNAAQTVGANGYVIKNDVRNLLSVLDQVLHKSQFAMGA